nr:hypothetical protein KXZ65_20150 [Pectobacterium sp. PL152]
MFDFNGFRALADSGTVNIVVTYADNSTESFNFDASKTNLQAVSSFTTISGATKVVITSSRYAVLQDINITDVRTAAVIPRITAATYDANTNVLTVTGANMVAGDTIDVSKLTLAGENGNTYTLTSSNVTAVNATTFSITLNSIDQLNVEGLLNKNGTTSAASGTTFNLAAAAGGMPHNLLLQPIWFVTASLSVMCKCPPSPLRRTTVRRAPWRLLAPIW